MRPPACDDENWADGRGRDRSGPRCSAARARFGQLAVAPRLVIPTRPHAPARRPACNSERTFFRASNARPHRWRTRRVCTDPGGRDGQQGRWRAGCPCRAVSWVRLGCGPSSSAQSPVSTTAVHSKGRDRSAKREPCVRDPAGRNADVPWVDLHRTGRVMSHIPPLGVERKQTTISNAPATPRRPGCTPTTTPV